MKKLWLVAALATLHVGCGGNQNQHFRNSEPGVPRLGTEQGNGTDYYNREDGSSWFLGGDKTIKYCYVVDRNFGASKDQIRRDLKGAFAKWAHYIQAKQVYAHVSVNGQLAIRSQLLSSCNGFQDITFYFGVRDQIVEPFIQNNTIAFAKRLKYDSVQGWSKGFVWLSPAGGLDPHVQYATVEQADFPNWSMKFNLFGVLVHELGHVYGCGHVAHTIMDERYFARLAIQEELNRALLLGRIDSWRELYICNECPIDAKGTLGMVTTTTQAGKLTTDDGTSEAFKFLTGRAPEGGPTAVKAQLIGSSEKGFKLLVSDNRQESLSFDLRLDDMSFRSMAIGGLNVFRTVLESYARFGTAGMTKASSLSGYGHEAFSLSGTIMSLTETSTKITLQRNMGSGNHESALQVNYLIYGQIKRLFSADPEAIGE